MVKSAKFTPTIHLVRRSFRSHQRVNVSQKKKSPLTRHTPSIFLLRCGTGKVTVTYTTVVLSAHFEKVTVEQKRDQQKSKMAKQHADGLKSARIGQSDEDCTFR